MYRTLQNSIRKLSTLTNGKWYFVSAGTCYANEITAIKLDDNKVFVTFIGGEFTEPYGKPFSLYFEYSKEALDEMWQYEFGKDYNHIPNPEEDDLDWVNDIASIPYTLLMDLRYEKKFIKEVKVESTFLLHD